jgi:hypothetical protein
MFQFEDLLSNKIFDPCPALALRPIYCGEHGSRGLQLLESQSYLYIWNQFPCAPHIQAGGAAETLDPVEVQLTSASDSIVTSRQVVEMVGALRGDQLLVIPLLVPFS